MRSQIFDFGDIFGVPGHVFWSFLNVFDGLGGSDSYQELILKNIKIFNFLQFSCSQVRF